MQFESIREALKYLLEINSSRLNPEGTTTVYTTDENGTSKRKQTYEDLQEFNSEALADIADKLGMSDLYLNL